MQPSPLPLKTISIVGWSSASAQYGIVLETLSEWNIIINSIHYLHPSISPTSLSNIAECNSINEVLRRNPDLLVVFSCTSRLIQELENVPIHKPILFVNPHFQTPDALAHLAHFLSNPNRLAYLHFDKIQSSAFRYIQTLIKDKRLGSLFSIHWQEATPTNTQSLFSHLQEPLLFMYSLSEKLPSVLQAKDDAMGGHPANVWLNVQSEDHAYQGTIHLSHENPLPNRCILECDEGRIEWHFKKANQLYIHHNDSPDIAKIELLRDFSQIPFQAHYMTECSTLELIEESIRGILKDNTARIFPHPVWAHQEILNTLDTCMSQSLLAHHGWFQVDELARLQKTRPTIITHHA